VSTTTFYYNNGSTSSITSSTITNTSYTSGSTLVRVLLGTSVTSLGTSCFQDCFNLTSITLNSGLTSLPTNCFYGCSVLPSINIQYVTSLGTYCFYNCSLLTSIGTLSSNLTSLPNQCFQFCSALPSINIQYVTSLGTSCFSFCSGLTSITLSSSLTSLPQSCFQSCSALPSINIQYVTSLGTSCFQSCSKLTSITLNSSLTSLPQSCFQNCSILNNIVFNNQNNLTIAGTNVFTGIATTRSVTYYLTANASALSSASQTLYNSYFSPSVSGVTNNVTFNANPSCFNEGTKILCLNKELQESWIPIENLRKGDLVKTYLHGYRKIELIGKGYGKNIDKNLWNINMFIMKKSETNGLLEDLIVTGGHGILVDDLNEYKEENDKKFNGSTPKIDDKFILLSGVSKDFIILPEGYEFNYYHLVVEAEGPEDNDKRYGIWANGILSETPSKKQFLEAHYEMIE
jgi:hypothetical protein